jgi:septin family protein
MKLCKSHINYLQKVVSQLAMRQTMSYTLLILGEKNSAKIAEAQELIEKAINILKEVE